MFAASLEVAVAGRHKQKSVRGFFSILAFMKKSMVCCPTSMGPPLEKTFALCGIAAWRWRKPRTAGPYNLNLISNMSKNARHSGLTLRNIQKFSDRKKFFFICPFVFITALLPSLTQKTKIFLKISHKRQIINILHF